MKTEFNKIKRKVLIILLISVFMLVISIIGHGIIMKYIIEFNDIKLYIGAVVMGLLTILFILAVCGGSIFLSANKKNEDIEKVKKLGALDWGIFYFRIAHKIDVINKTD